MTTEEAIPLSVVEPVEAESAVLGALINDEKSWDKVGSLKPSDFTTAKHRMICEALLALERTGKPVDLVTVSDQARRHPDYDDHPDILDYLRILAEENFTSDRVEHYAGIIRDYSVQRDLRQACNKILTMVNSPEGRSAQDILSEAERAVLQVSDQEQREREDFVSLGSSFSDVVREIEAHWEWVRENPGKQLLTGTPTGYSDFDNVTSGLQPGELVILAAGPSRGKTSLAMNIAFNVAAGNIPGHERDVVAIFSMEMSARALADRMLAMVSSVPQNKLRNAQLDDANWKSLESAVALLADPKSRPNLYVYELSGITPPLIRRMARRLRASHKNRLDLIVIDYLQLIPGDNQREGNRNTELAAITRELKQIANELQTPVLCLSQLNRQGSSRENEGPRLQELRDSGAIEQDADIVMFLYQDKEDAQDSTSDNSVVKLQVAKNRNGPCFVMELVFDKPFFRFVQHSHDDYQGETPQISDASS